LITLALSQQNEHHLAFVYLGAVVAVVVHDVDLADQVPHGVEIAGRLDLMRRARAAGEKVGVTIDVDGQQEDDGARLLLQLLVERVEVALPQIAVDDEGRRALQAKAPRWRLSTSVHEVALASGVLTVGARTVEQVPATERLVRDVEAML